MPGLVETPGPPTPGLEFSISHQKVLLDINFLSRSLRGTTEITLSPHSADLKTIRLNCRQCRLTRLSINGKPPTSVQYIDPYEHLTLRWQAGVHQHHMLQERIEGQLKSPPDQELGLNVPKSVKIQELDPLSILDSTGRNNGDPAVIDLSQNTKNAAEQIARFSPVTIHVEFTIDEIRDGLQFVGWEPGELQYPHVYSQNSVPSAACCLFPCYDAIGSRCTWEITIRCPRTIGDALNNPALISNGVRNGLVNGDNSPHIDDDSQRNFSDEDKSLDLSVICSGDMTDEIIDSQDPTKKSTSFSCTTATAPQHIGFAIGPFEHVDLAAYRESDEDEKLGQNAIPVHGFCLPGRSVDLRNTCLPIAKAIDFITLAYGSYPFSNYKICFLDHMAIDCVDTASLSLCSSRLLFPEDVIEPIDRVTRQLVHALASQWMGVNIIPKEPTDTWAVVGIAYFITDMFMRKLSGNNDYRYRQKREASRICDLDVERPSIWECGNWMPLDSSHLDFISAKAPLVLFILDRRLMKTSGSTGLSRIISRVFLNAKVGDLVNGALNTQYFIRTCERLGHAKLDVFFNQWVFGAGCPLFRVSQRFNKKRLVVEMQIVQAQGEYRTAQDLQTETFMRDVKEDRNEVFDGGVQPVFTGPMTIRIHEADGTPYEHIVEIKDAMTKFEIPYNTKYKRLKRSRRQRERIVTGAATDFAGDNQEDVLLYCLGDVLQSEEEMQEWHLTEFSKEDEDKMSQESYEWIRMDADFEWICKMQLGMPPYMYLSQLQQDRDVVAQFESVEYFARVRENPVFSTILLRTLMDTRYYHGIRTTAAWAIAKHAKDEVGWIGLFHLKKAFQEFFCVPGTDTLLSNDFSNRVSFYVQCAIPKSLAYIRDNSGRSPFAARKFLLEKLSYNDNSNNQHSDSHYLCILMTALTEAISSAPPLVEENDLSSNHEEEDNMEFYNSCLEEIERHRRSDEWIPSYHNQVSATAIDCKRILARAGAIPRNPADFLQYTQEGCQDDLRLKAFECLMDLGMSKISYVLQWFLFVLSTDSSPYIRTQMLRLFGKTLGSIAIGKDSGEAPTNAALQIGLIIEQESSTEARQADLSRRQTVSGALEALKKEIGTDPTLKASLWKAIESPRISLRELGDLLEICALLYDKETSMLLRLSLPRYYRVRSAGKSTSPTGAPRFVLTFSRTDRVRTKPIPKLTLTAPRPPAPPSSIYELKREDRSLFGAVTVAPPPHRTILKMPKKPGTPGFSSTNGLSATVSSSPVQVVVKEEKKTPPIPVSQKPKVILKLKLGGPKKPPPPPQ